MESAISLVNSHNETKRVELYFDTGYMSTKVLS